MKKLSKNQLVYYTDNSETKGTDNDQSDYYRIVRNTFDDVYLISNKNSELECDIKDLKVINSWKYHRSHSFVHEEEDEKFQFITQLYQIGVYGIVNGDARMQGSYKPSNIVNLERKAKKSQEKGEIKELTFGLPINVMEDKDGFYKEIPDYVS